jgi:hypothetical protein
MGILQGCDEIFRNLESELIVPLAVDNPNCNIKKAKNFCSFKILGTTFSGHPTRTTLGNTL